MSGGEREYSVMEELKVSNVFTVRAASKAEAVRKAKAGEFEHVEKSDALPTGRWHAARLVRGGGLR